MFGLRCLLFSKYKCSSPWSDCWSCDKSHWPPTSIQAVAKSFLTTMWKHVRFNCKLSLGNVMEPRTMQNLSWLPCLLSKVTVKGLRRIMAIGHSCYSFVSISFIFDDVPSCFNFICCFINLIIISVHFCFFYNISQDFTILLMINLLYPLVYKLFNTLKQSPNSWSPHYTQPEPF